MDKVVDKIAAFRVLGLILLVAMHIVGFAGAAALITALAVLGGPIGMLGGIALLGVEGCHKRSQSVQISGSPRVGVSKFRMRVLQQARAGLQLPDRELKVMDLIPVRTPVERVGMCNAPEVGGVAGTVGKQPRPPILLTVRVTALTTHPAVPRDPGRTAGGEQEFAPVQLG